VADPKITPELESRAREEDDDALVEVVVELAEPSSEQASMDELKAAFRESAEPVAEAIAGLGGEVQGEAWINRTLKARVPARGLSDLSNIETVAALDVPHGLTPE
jgi:hypothetical protein